MLPIRLPALRERLADLEPLADALLDDIARRGGLPHKNLTAAALDLLARQAWPGNIRELRNVLEQSALMTDDLMLDARHFDGVLTAAASPGAPQAVPDAAGSPEPAQRAAEPQRRSEQSMAVRPLPEQVAELERQAIARALQATGGNRLAAARLLRMSRAAFYDRLARYPELGTCGRSI